MNSEGVALEFMREYLNVHSCTHFRNLLNVYSHLKSCDFEDVAFNVYNKHNILYNGFLTLMSSTLNDKKLFNPIDGSFITIDCFSNWNLLIMRSFYYFKMFFPAMLFFFQNPKYDCHLERARKLILNRYSINTFSKSREEYDLCEGWRLKVKFLRSEYLNSCFYPFNIINNKLLTNTRDTTIKAKTISVNYEDVEHIATIIYKNYAFMIRGRSFIICREKTMNLKFANVYKLRFSAPLNAKAFLGTYSIETNIPLYFLFRREKDLKTLVQIHNAYACSSQCSTIAKIPLPAEKKSAARNAVYNLDEFVQHLSTIYTSKKHNCQQSFEPICKRTLTQYLEKTGFISVYDLKDYKSLAYVKNRVIHLTSMFKRPMLKKPFFEKKGKPLVKVEKMVKNITMTRYKTETANLDKISFNINYQGPLSTLQLALARFLNENGNCKILNKLWVSNVCTTLDSIHSGILNTHNYRSACLGNDDRMSYQMINFPAIVTLFNQVNSAQSIINNRTSLNTCRMYGDELKQSLIKCVDFIKSNSENDPELVDMFYQVERKSSELIPRNVITLLHLLNLFKESKGFSAQDIVSLFTKDIVCSRLIMTSNRSFCVSNLYKKSYKSDAVENISVKSVKYDRVHPPLIINRKRLYRQIKKKFADVGSLSKRIFHQRGRNANLVDIILNSKDEFFLTNNCLDLINKLHTKYKHFPSTKSELEIIREFVSEEMAYFPVLFF